MLKPSTELPRYWPASLDFPDSFLAYFTLEPCTYLHDAACSFVGQHWGLDVVSRLFKDSASADTSWISCRIVVGYPAVGTH